MYGIGLNLIVKKKKNVFGVCLEINELIVVFFNFLSKG